MTTRIGLPRLGCCCQIWSLSGTVPFQAPHKGGICFKRFYDVVLTLNCVAYESNKKAKQRQRYAGDSSARRAYDGP